MVIPVVFLLLVVVSPTAAIIDTDFDFDARLDDSGGIGRISGGGDGNLGLGFIACNPMPACPANYQRLGIPAGVAGAGTVLQSCYRVILARNPPFLNFRVASQLCSADNAAPVEFNIAGEFAAVSTLLTATPIAGTFFTGHSDAFNTIDQGILGINSEVAAVGVAFPNGFLPGADCGVITGATPTSPACRINQSGVICEIRLDGATCFCPPGTG